MPERFKPVPPGRSNRVLACAECGWPTPRPSKSCILHRVPCLMCGSKRREWARVRTGPIAWIIYYWSLWRWKMEVSYARRS